MSDIEEAARQVLRERFLASPAGASLEELGDVVQVGRRRLFELTNDLYNFSNTVTRATDGFNDSAISLREAQGRLGYALRSTALSRRPDFQQRPADFADELHFQFRRPIGELVDAIGYARSFESSFVEFFQERLHRLRDGEAVVELADDVTVRHQKTSHVIAEAEEQFLGVTVGGMDPYRIRNDDDVAGLLNEISRVGWTHEVHSEFAKLSDAIGQRGALGELVRDRVHQDLRHLNDREALADAELVVADLSRSSAMLSDADDGLQRVRSTIINGYTKPDELHRQVAEALERAEDGIRRTPTSLTDADSLATKWRAVGNFLTDSTQQVERVSADTGSFDVLFTQQDLRGRIALTQTKLALTTEQQIESGADVALDKTSAQIVTYFGEPPIDPVLRDQWRIGVGKAMFLGQALGFGKETLFASESRSAYGPQAEFVAEELAAIGNVREQLDLPAVDLLPTPATTQSKGMGPQL